jgi:putative transposase
MVVSLLDLIAQKIPLTYLLLDGHFGNNNGLCMARQTGLHIISKLRHDSALYFPYNGPQPPKGQRRKYGDRLNCRKIPIQYLERTTIDKNIQTCTYNAQLLHEEFCQPINVVVILKTNLVTKESAHVLLFSSDLGLSYDKLVDYYSLRFQIEFNFRDAKQFWGLEDFMNISENAVTNAANLSFFMVNLSHRLLQDFRVHNRDAGIHDRWRIFPRYSICTGNHKHAPEKTTQGFRARKYLLLIASLGRIHAPLTFHNHFIIGEGIVQDTGFLDPSTIQNLRSIGTGETPILRFFGIIFNWNSLKLLATTIPTVGKNARTYFFWHFLEMV